LALPPSILQPTAAKTKQGCSEMTQPSGSSALRRTLIPHQDFQGTWVLWYSFPGSGTSHQLCPPELLAITGTVCWLPANAERFYLGEAGRLSSGPLGRYFLTHHFNSWEVGISE